MDVNINTTNYHYFNLFNRYTMNKGDQKLRTKILELETEYRQLIASETSTLQEMQRIDEIEQLLFYVREWKWEAVRTRLTTQTNS